MTMFNMKIHNISLLVFCLAISPMGTVYANDSARGLQIATAADDINTGFVDSTVEFDMTLTNTAGDSVTRKLSLLTLEGVDNGDKSIVIFNSPRDVKGTGLLTWSQSEGSDEQWLYLPSLSRVKRISSDNKAGSFMGSEFSFEDLGSQEIDKYDYLYLRDEVLDGVPTYVIQRVPNYEKSGYSKQVLWLDQSNYNNYKIEYFDRGGKLLKTLRQSGFSQYDNKYWRAETMVMQNHQTRKSTTLTWDNYKFGNNLSASLFTKNRLKRLR